MGIHNEVRLVLVLDYVSFAYAAGLSHNGRGFRHKGTGLSGLTGSVSTQPTQELDGGPFQVTGWSNDSIRTRRRPNSRSAAAINPRWKWISAWLPFGAVNDSAGRSLVVLAGIESDLGLGVAAID